MIPSLFTWEEKTQRKLKQGNSYAGCLTDDYARLRYYNTIDLYA